MATKSTPVRANLPSFTSTGRYEASGGKKPSWYRFHGRVRGKDGWIPVCTDQEHMTDVEAIDARHHLKMKVAWSSEEGWIDVAGVTKIEKRTPNGLSWIPTWSRQAKTIANIKAAVEGFKP